MRRLFRFLSVAWAVVIVASASDAAQSRAPILHYNVQNLLILPKIDAAASSGDVAHVTSGVRTLSRDVTISTIQLEFERGVVITPSRGVTFTIASKFDHVPEQVFDVSQGGTVIVSGGNTVRPEWWGGTDDESIQYAVNSAAQSTDGATVLLRAATYTTDDFIQLDSNVRLIGSGKYETTIYLTDPTVRGIIQVAMPAGGNTVSNVEIAYMTLTHELPSSQDVYPGAGIFGGESTASYVSTSDVYIHDVVIRDLASDGIQAWKSPVRWTVHRVQMRRVRGGIFYANAENPIIAFCDIEDTGDDAIAMNDSSDDAVVVFNRIHRGGMLATPGGRAINVNGDRALIGWNAITDSEFAGIRVTENNGETSTPTDTRLLYNSIIGMPGGAARAHGYFISNVAGTLEIRGGNVSDATGEGGKAFHIAGGGNGEVIRISGVRSDTETRGIDIEGSTSEIYLEGNEFAGDSTLLEVSDNLTVDRLISRGNIWRADAGTTIVNFETPGSGSTVSLAEFVDDRALAADQFIRIPSGDTITSLKIDLAEETVTTVLNDLGGSGVGAYLTSGVSPIGYRTGAGAGGSVAQDTNKSTAVTLSKITGLITTHSANLADATAVSFTWTNTLIGATDVVIVNVDGGTAGAYVIDVAPAAGSAVVTIRNVSGGDLAEAIPLRFAVIKGAVN